MNVSVTILNGISYAMLLFLIASGLSLIFGVMGILNLGHGGFYMFGGYLGVLAVKLGGNWAFGLLAAPIVVGLLGYAVERGLLRHLYKELNDQALVTSGLIYIFGNMALWVWPAPRTIMGSEPSVLAGSVDMGGLLFPVYRLAIIGIGIVVFLGLLWFQEKTRGGAIIRAGMDDKQMVTGLGINYGLVSSLVFILGAAIAGLAGFLGAPVIGASADQVTSMLLMALIIIIVGGVGYVQGTLIGALVIGLADSLGKGYFPFLASIIPYVVMVFVLLARPYGLFGRAR